LKVKIIFGRDKDLDIQGFLGFDELSIYDGNTKILIKYAKFKSIYFLEIALTTITTPKSSQISTDKQTTTSTQEATYLSRQKTTKEAKTVNIYLLISVILTGAIVLVSIIVTAAIGYRNKRINSLESNNFHTSYISEQTDL
jgi:hypothetical protein